MAAHEPTASALGVRDANRAAFERRLRETAMRRLADEGAAGLGMRALARDLDVTPGALYRYVASRDELLTMLVVAAYRGLGEAVEQALVEAARHPRGDAPSDELTCRWIAVWRAVRAWALDHRHEYALVFGTPVPGYAAPAETIEPASAVTRALAGVAVERFERFAAREPRSGGLAGGSTGGGGGDGGGDALSALAGDLARIRAWLAANGVDDVTVARLPDAALVAVVRAWTELFGTVSFELFGHYVGSIESRGAYLDIAAQAALDALDASIGGE